MNNQKKLEELKVVLENQKRKLEIDKQNLQVAMKQIMEREAKIYIFETTICKMTPVRPYFKNNTFRCNFCHKAIKPGMEFCPYCLQKFTWDENAESTIYHYSNDDPIKATEEIITNTKENYI